LKLNPVNSFNGKQNAAQFTFIRVVITGFDPWMQSKYCGLFFLSFTLMSMKYHQTV